MDKFAMKLTQKRLKQYCRANKKEKNSILSDYCQLTGVERNTAYQHFFRAWHGSAQKGRKEKKKRGAKKQYNELHKKVIEECWELAGCICGERLHPQMDNYLNQLIQHNDLLERYDKHIIEKVRKVSLGSLKLFLKDFPKARKKKSQKGNRELYKQIPIKAHFGDNTNQLGNIEVDYVEHSGGNSSGTFAITGCYVDIASQWTVRASGLGKHMRSVGSIHDKVTQKIYHRIREYHPDNCPAILSILFNKLQGKDVKKAEYELSRSRPYQKNDNAHVEQKNNDKVRKLVGYLRYDTEQEVKLLNELYDLADLYDNFFIASAKLKEKVKDEKGRTIKKIYETPHTPYQRLINSEDLPKKIKSRLVTIYKDLNMVKLRQRMNEILQKLLKSRNAVPLQK